MESDDFYYLIYKENKNCFQLMPKRVLLDVSVEKEFRDIVETKIGKVRYIAVGCQYRISMMVVAILYLGNIAFLLYSNFQSF